MPYSTALPGLGEAIRKRLKSIIQAEVTGSVGLNLALAQGGETPLVFTPAQVMLGDSWNLPASRISIVGGNANGQSVECEQLFAPRFENNGFEHFFYTTIYVYIHPSELGADDSAVRAEMLEIAQLRIIDHFRVRLFNTEAYTNIGTASKEYQTVAVGGFYDYVTDCKITAAKQDITERFLGSIGLIQYVELHHESRIA